MTEKRRPLRWYLKGLRTSQICCDCCQRLLTRRRLVCRGAVVSRSDQLKLDEPLDAEAWQKERQAWRVVCRFCSGAGSRGHNSFFDTAGFTQYLQEHSELSYGSMREYVTRLCRLDKYLAGQGVPPGQVPEGPLADTLVPWLPEKNAVNNRIVLRKYEQFMQYASRAQKS
ncbi:flagella biosynthesis regulatory protein FliZ [Salmonella enterica]|nr:flagella biosynthesis regulatory protein FliZ [Salmonella enterica]